MLTAVVLVLLIKTFAFTSCTIPSTGMENSLYQGERVLVNKSELPGFVCLFPLGDGWKTGRERGYRVIQ